MKIQQAKIQQALLGTLALLILPLPLLQGCAHTAAEQRLDGKLASETPARGQTDAQISKWIATAPGLSAEQRLDLGALRTSYTEQQAQLRDKSLKLRSLLVREVLSNEEHEAEVGLIQDRLKRVEDDRINLDLASTRQFNQILGRVGLIDSENALLFFNESDFGGFPVP